MASNSVAPALSLDDVMGQLKAIQQKQDELLNVVDSMSQGVISSPLSVTGLRPSPASLSQQQNGQDNEDTTASSAAALDAKSTATPPLRPADSTGSPLDGASPVPGSGFTSRIILT